MTAGNTRDAMAARITTKMVRLKTKAKLVFALKLWVFIGLLGTFCLFTQQFLEAYANPYKVYNFSINNVGEANLELCILASYYVAMVLLVVLKLTNKTHTISK